MERKVILTILIGIILFGATFFFLIDRLPQPSHGSMSQSPLSTTIVTPTPQIIYVTVTVTPTPTPIATFEEGNKQTTTTFPTISPRCNSLVLSVNDDLSFLNFVDNSNLISRIYLLMYDKCDTTTASQINQEIAKTNAKPKSPSLNSAREYMMSVSTWCIEPNSASLGRAKDDMKKVGNELKSYTDLVTSCQDFIDEDMSVLSKVSQQYEGFASFSGYGNRGVSFKVTGTGLRVFMMTYKGLHNFIVELKDENGEYVDLLANEIGSYSGKKSASLTAGTYKLDVTSSGSWTIIMTTI
jgi:hypothetical protein